MGKHSKGGCLLAVVKVGAVALAFMLLSGFTLRKCENDTGVNDSKGNRIYSPLIGDVVLVGHWLPGKEFADLTFSVPRGQSGTTVQATGGLWQNALNGRGKSAFFEVRPTRRLSDDDWWGECTIFIRGKNGMELASRHETHSRDAVRCSVDEKLPCRETGPVIVVAAELPPARLAC